MLPSTRPLTICWMNVSIEGSWLSPRLRRWGGSKNRPCPVTGWPIVGSALASQRPGLSPWAESALLPGLDVEPAQLTQALGDALLQAPADRLVVREPFGHAVRQVALAGREAA